jgi:hypothetical protein
MIILNVAHDTGHSDMFILCEQSFNIYVNLSKEMFCWDKQKLIVFQTNDPELVIQKALLIHSLICASLQLLGSIYSIYILQLENYYFITINFFQHPTSF